MHGAYDALYISSYCSNLRYLHLFCLPWFCFFMPLCSHVSTHVHTYKNNAVLRSLQRETTVMLVQQGSLSLRKVMAYPAKVI